MENTEIMNQNEEIVNNETAVEQKNEDTGAGAGAIALVALAGVGAAAIIGGAAYGIYKGIKALAHKVKEKGIRRAKKAAEELDVDVDLDDDEDTIAEEPED